MRIPFLCKRNLILNFLCPTKHLFSQASFPQRKKDRLPSRIAAHKGLNGRFIPAYKLRTAGNKEILSSWDDE